MSEFNEGHISEAQDRTLIISEMVQSLLVDHPAIVKAGVNEHIEDVLGELAVVYQELGQLVD